MSGGGGGAESGSIKALYHGDAFLETARFLHINLILDTVTALAKTVYIEHVTGIAWSGIVTYVITPVVAVTGSGANRLHSGGTHIGQLQIFQIAVSGEVKLYLKTVTHT